MFQFYAPTFLLFEVTTLFVNIRWLLVELGLKESKLYLYNGLSLMAAVRAISLPATPTPPSCCMRVTFRNQSAGETGKG